MSEIKRDYTQILKNFDTEAAEPQSVASMIDDAEIIQLSVDALNHFPNHPFTLYTGDKFDDLTESIKTHGVLTPLLIRKLEDNTYQILSGHNRCEAAKAASLQTVPCIVLNSLTDDDALMILLDSNTKQRGITEMKISEQAHIFALDVEVNKRQGKRSDLVKSIEENLKIFSGNKPCETFSQIGKRLNTVQEVGEKYGVSKNTIARLLRINVLSDELKMRIDAEDIAVNAGVELSYLSLIEQKLVDNLIAEYNYKVDIKKSQHLRQLSQNGKLDRVTAVEVFENRYDKPSSVIQSLKSVTLKSKFLSKYYTAEVSQTAIAEEVEASVDVWQEIKKLYPLLSTNELKEKIREILKQQV